jgi:hypothetical protein
VHTGGFSQRGSPMKEDADDEEELAAVMKRLQDSSPPADVLKVRVDECYYLKECVLNMNMHSQVCDQRNTDKNLGKKDMECSRWKYSTDKSTTVTVISREGLMGVLDQYSS